MLLRTWIAERLPWTPKARPGHAEPGPDDYEYVMLCRLRAGLPVGTPKDWDRPDPVWPEA
jgi:hypothetical protein